MREKERMGAGGLDAYYHKSEKKIKICPLGLRKFNTHTFPTGFSLPLHICLGMAQRLLTGCLFLITKSLSLFKINSCKQ